MSASPFSLSFVACRVLRSSPIDPAVSKPAPFRRSPIARHDAPPSIQYGPEALHSFAHASSWGGLAAMRLRYQRNTPPAATPPMIQGASDIEGVAPDTARGDTPGYTPGDGCYLPPRALKNCA